MSYRGEGCRKDFFNAFQLYKKASELGHANSFYMMARMI